MVSPGPLPHVRWQSIPSCLHSSDVKTATSGPGLARTPLNGSVRAGEDVQGHTCGYPPLCAMRGCTYVCMAVPCVSTCVWMCSCSCAWAHGHPPATHEYMSHAGGFCRGGNLRIPRGPSGLWAGTRPHTVCRWAVFPCPAPCLFESPVPESGLFQTQLTAPRGSWKKQGGQDEIKCGEPICLAELDVSHISLYLTLPPIPGGIKV